MRDTVCGLYFQHRVMDHFNLTLGKGSVRTGTPHEDFQKGTDFFLYGIPVDVTLRDKGGQIKAVIGKFQTEAYAVILGIREWNSHVKFPQPVLVMWFCIKNPQINQVDRLVQMITYEHLNEAMDRYVNYIDPSEEALTSR
jgi:hypothetical protein